jgi:hypothetical protein
MAADELVIRGSGQPFGANVTVAVYLIVSNVFQSVDVTAVLQTYIGDISGSNLVTWSF